MFKKIKVKDFGIAFFYNFFSSFILGTFPILLFYYTLPEKNFKEKLQMIVPRNDISIYYLGIALIGIFLKIGFYISSRECRDCRRFINIQTMPNKMLNPLISIYQLASGILIALGIISLIRNSITIFVYIAIIAMFFIVFISIIDIFLEGSHTENDRGT